MNPDSEISDSVCLSPVDQSDINDEYVSWYENHDGHLDYFTGSGRTFDRQGLVADYRRGLERNLKRWFYYLISQTMVSALAMSKLGRSIR